MLYNLKRFISLKLKEVEYSFRTYVRNREVRYSFSFNRGLSNRQIFSTSISVGFLVVLFVIWMSNRHFNEVEELLIVSKKTISLKTTDTVSVVSVVREEKGKNIREANTKIKIENGKNEDDYSILVDKNKKLLFVLGSDNKIVKRVSILTGARKGEKMVKGDKKTPSGAYRIVEIKNDAELLPKYGPHAFVLNYPNEIDVKKGKTGSGIWIHGTGGDGKQKSTRGCVAADDSMIMFLTNYIKKNTKVLIYPEEFSIPVNSDVISANFLSESFLYSIIDKKMHLENG